MNIDAGQEAFPDLADADRQGSSGVMTIAEEEEFWRAVREELPDDPVGCGSGPDRADVAVESAIGRLGGPCTADALRDLDPSGLLVDALDAIGDGALAATGTALAHGRIDARKARMIADRLDGADAPGTGVGSAVPACCRTAWPGSGPSCRRVGGRARRRPGPGGGQRPGCVVPAQRTELDHTVPFGPSRLRAGPGDRRPAAEGPPRGDTAAHNRAPLCAPDHLAKTLGVLRLAQPSQGVLE